MGVVSVEKNCENVRRAGMKPRVVSVIVAATMALVVTQAAVPAVAKAKDPRAASWRRALVQDVHRHPRIARAAIAHVKGGPLFLQVMYVAGAILGHSNHGTCTLAQVDARGFDASTHQAFINPTNSAYFKSQGLSVQQVLTTYRDGVVFGCKF
jgi:hypothetical protein